MLEFDNWWATKPEVDAVLAMLPAQAKLDILTVASLHVLIVHDSVENDTTIVCAIDGVIHLVGEVS